MRCVCCFSGRIKDCYGGGQVYVRNLLEGFQNFSDAEICGVALHITDGKCHSERIVFKGYTIHQLSGNREACHQAFMDILQKFKPQIIHAHGEKEVALKIAAELQIPCIVTAHHGGIICPAGASLNYRDEICGLPVSDKNCLQCVCRNIPGSKFWYVLLRCIPLKLRLKLAAVFIRRRFMLFLTPVFTATAIIQDKLRTIEMLKHAACIIAPCKRLRCFLEINELSSNVSVLPHGIPEISPRPLPPLQTPIRFFYLGRINPCKGLHVMLKAFQEIPVEEYELHVLGEGVTTAEKHYWHRLKQQAKKINVIWHGAIAHDEIVRVMEQCHVMIHPALCLEIYGLNIAESLSCGRPVLATRCGGAEMQVHDGKNGWLIPPNDAVALHEKLVWLLAHPQAISSAALQCSIPPFAEHIDRLLELYESVST